MKRSFLISAAIFLSFLIPSLAFSQKGIGIGIKGGINFANVTNASSFGGSNRTGFNAGVFLNIGKSIIGSRTEILFSQQGYSYSNDSASGTVTHNYISLAQLLAINITKYVQLQLGFQTGYLLNAKVNDNQSTGNASADKILSLYNRFDYGFTGGLEIHPYKGILFGARYNVSFSNLYKTTYTDSLGTPSPYSTQGVDFKNNIVQVFVGYRF